MAAAKLGDRIVRQFLKSVGAHLGLYRKGAFVPDLESQPLYQKNLEIVHETLKSGRISAGEIEQLIWERYRARQEATFVSEILPKLSPAQRTDPNENLLEDGVVYVHRELFTQAPPSFFVSFEQEVMECRDPGLRQRKERYTLQELVRYFYRTLRLPAPEDERRQRRDLGTARYLLDGWRVDEVLHAIDEAADQGGLISLIKLEDYLPEARRDVRERLARRPRAVRAEQDLGGTMEVGA